MNLMDALYIYIYDLDPTDINASTFLEQYVVLVGVFGFAS